mgnify:CR=1 FL=1
MTAVNGLVIANFESKLNRLMEVHTQLLRENAALRERLELQTIELDKVREQNAELAASYKNLKLAKIISANDQEIGDTQRRLARLVREVERCIALLNASEQKDDML